MHICTFPAQCQAFITNYASTIKDRSNLERSYVVDILGMNNCIRATGRCKTPARGARGGLPTPSRSATWGAWSMLHVRGMGVAFKPHLLRRTKWSDRRRDTAIRSHAKHAGLHCVFSACNSTLPFPYPMVKRALRPARSLKSLINIRARCGRARHCHLGLTRAPKGVRNANFDQGRECQSGDLD